MVAVRALGPARARALGRVVERIVRVSETDPVVGRVVHRVVCARKQSQPACCMYNAENGEQKLRTSLKEVLAKGERVGAAVERVCEDRDGDCAMTKRAWQKMWVSAAPERACPPVGFFRPYRDRDSNCDAPPSAAGFPPRKAAAISFGNTCA